MAHYAWIRRPRTIAERRAGATRAKRGNLPSDYDDIMRRPQRCWKTQRRTRWRRLAGMDMRRHLDDMAALHQECASRP